MHHYTPEMIEALRLTIAAYDRLIDDVDVGPWSKYPSCFACRMCSVAEQPTDGFPTFKACRSCPISNGEHRGCGEQTHENFCDALDAAELIDSPDKRRPVIEPAALARRDWIIATARAAGVSNAEMGITGDRP